MTNDLEIRHCRVLVALSDHGGVSAAARALGISQSTAAIASVTAENRGVIRLGTVESVSSLLLPRALSALRADWPLVEVQVTIGLCEHLRKRVQRGELDAALTVEGLDGAHAPQAGWSRMLAPAQLRLIVSSRTGPPPAGVKRADLSRHVFLLPDPDGALNALMRDWLGKSVRRPRLESAGSIGGVKSGVKESDVIGVLPSYAVAEEIQTGTLQELRVQEPLPAVAIWLTTQRQALESSPLLDIIQRFEEVLQGSDLIGLKALRPSEKPERPQHARRRPTAARAGDAP